MQTVDSLFYEAALSRSTFDYIARIEDPFVKSHAERYLRIRYVLAVVCDPNARRFEGCRLNWHFESLFRSDFIRTALVPTDFHQRLQYPGTRMAVLITPVRPAPGNNLNAQQMIPLLMLACDVHIMAVNETDADRMQLLFSYLTPSTSVQCITVHSSHLSAQVFHYLEVCFSEPTLKSFSVFGGRATPTTIAAIEQFLIYGSWRYACITGLMISDGSWRFHYASVDLLSRIISAYFAHSFYHSIARFSFNGTERLATLFHFHRTALNEYIYLSPDFVNGDNRYVQIVLEAQIVMLYFRKHY